ncbi:hypothetical protein ES703_102969 [subsurface metagenome]
MQTRQCIVVRPDNLTVNYITHWNGKILTAQPLDDPFACLLFPCNHDFIWGVDDNQVGAAFIFQGLSGI